MSGAVSAEGLVRDILEVLADRAAVLSPYAKTSGQKLVVMFELTGAEIDALAAAGAALEDLEPEAIEDDGLGEAAWQGEWEMIA